MIESKVIPPSKPRVYKEVATLPPRAEFSSPQPIEEAVQPKVEEVEQPKE